jgi:hypothetical protein
MHRTPVMEPRSGSQTESAAPHIRREECTNYVDLARRMSIPADDAIRQFIDTWVTKIRVNT